MGYNQRFTTYKHTMPLTNLVGVGIFAYAILVLIVPAFV